MSLIRITKNAHKMLVEINKQYKKDYISFGIKSGGCSGFQYILEPCNKKPNKSVTKPGIINNSAAKAMAAPDNIS